LDSIYLPFSKDRVFVKVHQGNTILKYWKTLPELYRSFNITDTELTKVLIGSGQLEDKKRLLWGIEIPNVMDNQMRSNFLPWREALAVLNTDEIKLFLIGRNLLLHQRSFTYCPRCGNQLEYHESGHSRECIACKSKYMAWYPRIDPCIITLITHVNNKQCLLVRHPKHSPGIYTCVAGFLESGETIEECVSREVFEEVGLLPQKNSLRYSFSQPWPTDIGQNIMMGYTVSVKDKNFILDKQELEDARWFTREEVKEMVTISEQCYSVPNTEIKVPSPWTSSFRLIKNWTLEE